MNQRIHECDGARRRALLGIAAAIAMAAAVACSSATPVDQSEPDSPTSPGEPTPNSTGIRVPAGFAIEIFREGLSGVRTLRMGPDGFLYAALSDAGRIVRLAVPGGASGAAEETLITGLNRPYGLAFHEGSLFIGERNRIVRRFGSGFGSQEVVVTGLPGSGHWTREIAFGPDGKLYLSLGSSCNVCEESDDRRAAVTRYEPDGSGETVIARGLRNAAGMDWHPETAELWVSQNERDHLGDDLPPEEINIVREGAHYGWPYCYGDRIPNPEYAGTDRCAGTEPPALEMQAHSAPLGMVFYEGDQFPDAYRGDLFLAFHGSWNRSERTGYKLVRVRVENGLPTGHEDFATGWLVNGQVRGRPVYPEVGPDGSLYLSDDGGGRIYRIWYEGQ